MDPQALNTLTNCIKLSLSSNTIDKMIPLTNLSNNKIKFPKAQETSKFSLSAEIKSKRLLVWKKLARL